MCSSPSTTNAITPNSLQQDNIISPQPTTASSLPTSVIPSQLTNSTSSQRTSVISSQSTSVVPSQLITSSSSQPTSVISSQPTSVVPSQLPGVVHSQPTTMLSSQPSKVFSPPSTNEATDVSHGVVSLQQPNDVSAQSTNILSSQSSSSISLQSTSIVSPQPLAVLSQSMERSNHSVVTPQAPFHDTPYSAVPSAVNTLLDMDYYDVGNEVMMSDSEGMDSGLSPNSSTSLSHSVFNTTPQNIGVNRSFSLPPRPMYPRMRYGAGSYRHTSADYVSELL